MAFSNFGPAFYHFNPLFCGEEPILAVRTTANAKNVLYVQIVAQLTSGSRTYFYRVIISVARENEAPTRHWSVKKKGRNPLAEERVLDLEPLRPVLHFLGLP